MCMTQLYNFFYFVVETICPEISVNSKKQACSIDMLMVKQLGLLTTLNVSGCKITSQGADMMAEVLLQTILLEKLDISNTTLDAAKADKISSPLEKVASLKTLDISNNLIGSEALLTTLSRSLTLEELNISENLLTFSSIVKIAQSFRHHPTIRKLDFSNNMISFSSACEFIVDIILSVNQKLVYLNVSGRNIRPRFVDDYLSLSNNDSSSSGFALQDLYLQQKFPSNYYKLIRVNETCPISKEDVISYYVDHKGGLFYHHHNFVIFVPPCAVTQGDYVEIQATANHFGPYEIPDDFYPISNFFWLSADYRFKVSVYIIMSHYAKIRSLEDIDHLLVLQTCNSIIAGEKYILTKVPNGIYFDHKIGYCVLATDHFCSYVQAKATKYIPEYLTAFYFAYNVSDNSHTAEVCFCPSQCCDCEKVASCVAIVFDSCKQFNVVL